MADVESGQGPAASDLDKLLEWRNECAALLESLRAFWRETRGFLPPNLRRRSFVVPAVAVTVAFVAGAVWLLGRQGAAAQPQPDQAPRNGTPAPH
jgi:hypothetical protein